MGMRPRFSIDIDIAIPCFCAYFQHCDPKDALWAGIPILTLQGRTFASRVASSVVLAAGIPELVCHAEDEYDERAVALATDLSRYTSIREKLLHPTSLNLFNTNNYIKNLEDAYMMMWDQHQSGRGPQHIVLKKA